MPNPTPAHAPLLIASRYVHSAEAVLLATAYDIEKAIVRLLEQSWGD